MCKGTAIIEFRFCVITMEALPIVKFMMPVMATLVHEIYETKKYLYFLKYVDKIVDFPLMLT